MASTKIIELHENNTCKICDNSLAKYSCPKCDILYCSLTCYQAQKHLSCSETFYKECIFENLDPSDREASSKKMTEILQKYHEENQFDFTDEYENDEEQELDSDDDEYEDIFDRLANVNLDDAEEVWTKLTDDERQEFAAFLQSEDVTKLIPPWKPWWLYRNDSKVEVAGEESEYKKNCPKIMPCKDFKTITTKPPADCVKYNLMNVLASYALAARYFNGEHFDFAKEASTCISILSLTLKSAVNFDDLETAVKSVEQECVNTEWITVDKENIETMKEDVAKLLNGPTFSETKFYALSALSDVFNLFEAALNEPNKQKNGGQFENQFPNTHFPDVKLETKSKIRNHLRKIEYFLSYVNTFDL